MEPSTVEVTTMAGNAADIDLSMIGLIMQADMVVKAVMLMLVLASVWCWAIIFNKYKEFKKTRKRAYLFEKAYHTSRVFTPLYRRIYNHVDNPMASMFVTGMNEIKNGVLKGQPNPDSELIEAAKERVFFSLQRVKSLALEKMQKDLVFLATIGSTAPFIGLFGTVWGIVNSFKAIAASKNTTLAVVAPGIAEALLATAIGLFAAIPAVIFYNIFSNEIRRVAEKLEDFSGELSVLLIRNAVHEKDA